MGISTTRPSQFINFYPEDWVAESKEEITSCTTYHHRLINQQLDKYVLHFQNQQQEQLYYSHTLNRVREDHIVNVVHY